MTSQNTVSQFLQEILQDYFSREIDRAFLTPKIELLLYEFLTTEILLQLSERNGTKLIDLLAQNPSGKEVQSFLEECIPNFPQVIQTKTKEFFELLTNKKTAIK